MTTPAPVPDGEQPVAYTPEADVPLTPIEGVTDQRILDISADAFNLQLLIRRLLPEGPNVELACRYVDLAVQAAYTTAQDSPPAASGEAPPQP